jgi:hypothetical protein
MSVEGRQKIFGSEDILLGIVALLKTCSRLRRSHAEATGNQQLLVS